MLFKVAYDISHITALSSTPIQRCKEIRGTAKGLAESSTLTGGNNQLLSAAALWDMESAGPGDHPTC